MASSVDVNGQLIEHLRKTRACLSRRDAARRLKLSEPTLYFIERGRNGRYRTQPETLARIARLLNVEPSEIARPREVA
jgi:transcriptional regulator with XRE-family HTH domain